MPITVPLAALTTKVANFALEFSFKYSDPHYAKVTGPSKEILYALGGPQPTVLEITNPSSTSSLSLHRLSGPVGPAHCHFALRFRPGTLANPESIHPRDAAWVIAHARGPDGVDKLYLQRRREHAIAPGATLKIELDSVSAKPFGGSRSTNVALDFRNLSAGKQPVMGTRLQHLAVLNDYATNTSVFEHIDTLEEAVGGLIDLRDKIVPPLRAEIVRMSEGLAIDSRLQVTLQITANPKFAATEDVDGFYLVLGGKDGERPTLVVYTEPDELEVEHINATGWAATVFDQHRKIEFEGSMELGSNFEELPPEFLRPEMDRTNPDFIEPPPGEVPPPRPWRVVELELTLNGPAASLRRPSALRLAFSNINLQLVATNVNESQSIENFDIWVPLTNGAAVTSRERLVVWGPARYGEQQRPVLHASEREVALEGLVAITGALRIGTPPSIGNEIRGMLDVNGQIRVSGGGVTIGSIDGSYCLWVDGASEFKGPLVVENSISCTSIKIGGFELSAKEAELIRTWAGQHGSA